MSPRPWTATATSSATSGSGRGGPALLLRGGGAVRPDRGGHPAPESSHAIRAAIHEALAAKAEGKPRTILFNLSGHGHVDMRAYDAYFAGELEDFAYPAEKVQESLRHLPNVKLPG